MWIYEMCYTAPRWPRLTFYSSSTSWWIQIQLTDPFLIPGEVCPYRAGTVARAWATCGMSAPSGWWSRRIGRGSCGAPGARLPFCSSSSRLISPSGATLWKPSTERQMRVERGFPTIERSGVPQENIHFPVIAPFVHLTMRRHIVTGQTRNNSMFFHYMAEGDNQPLNGIRYSFIPGGCIPYEKLYDQYKICIWCAGTMFVHLGSPSSCFTL